MNTLLKLFIPRSRVEYAAMITSLGTIATVTSFAVSYVPENRLEREAEISLTHILSKSCPNPQQEKGYFSLRLGEGEAEAFCNVDCKDIREGRQALIVCYRQQPAIPETPQ